MEERNYKLYVHISPSGKRYYGITCQEKCEYRWNDGKGYRTQQYFYRAINKYGWDNFQHIVLFNNLTKDEACLLEQCYIALYDTTNPKYGYNINLGGEHGLHSDETKRKLSENNAKYWKGKTLTEEHKRKIGEASKGRKHTETTKRKIAEANKGNTYSKGKHLSKETKKKMSEAKKGKHFTEEHKKKLSESMKAEKNHNYGKHFTEEHKRKIGEGNKGKPKLKGKDNPNSKAILMFTKEDEFIKRFDCIREAIQYLGKDNGSNISKCAKGKIPTAYGYKWKYEEDFNMYRLTV